MNNLSLNNNTSFKSASLNKNARINNRVINNTEVKDISVYDKDSVSFTSKENIITYDLLKSVRKKLKKKGSIAGKTGYGLTMRFDNGLYRTVRVSKDVKNLKLSIETNYETLGPSKKKHVLVGNIHKYELTFKEYRKGILGLFRKGIKETSRDTRSFSNEFHIQNAKFNPKEYQGCELHSDVSATIFDALNQVFAYKKTRKK